MDAPSPTAAGIVGSLRALGAGLAASLRDRIELFSIEMDEEKSRFFRTAIGFGAAFFAGAMAMVFASLTLVYLFWESARLTVLVALTVFYAGLLVMIVLGLRRYLLQQPRPFAATLEELRDDGACIRGQI